MKLIINWVGAIVIALVILSMFSHIVNSAPKLSEGQRLADTRYQQCLLYEKDFAMDSNPDRYIQFEPQKCDGALGQYGKPNSNN